MSLRLHLGCGPRYLPGHVNIDRWAPGRKDVAADIAALPFREGAVDEIYASHLIEHLPRAKVLPALRHWAALLRPGGKLAVECPNLEEVCRRFLAADERAREAWWVRVLYGLQTHPGEFHLNNFTPTMLRRAMEAAGFTGIVIGPGAEEHRTSCGMRAEGVKGSPS